MVKNVRHIGIVVEDLNASLNFYTSLGFEIDIWTHEPIDFIDVISAKKGLILETVKLRAPDDSMIELLYYGNDTIKETRTLFGTGAAHVAFTVDNIWNVCHELEEKGVPFNSRPQLAPNGFAKVVFCKAPEGTFIELVEEVVQ